MANRVLTATIPIWARVSGIIVLVLVATLAGALLVGATFDTGMDHGVGGMENGPGEAGPRGH